MHNINCLSKIRDFWMRKDFLEMWNHYGLDDADLIELINRTSNALERVNRHMKYNVFYSNHQSITKFVEGLQEEGERVVQRVDDMRRGRELPSKKKESPSPLFRRNTTIS